MPLVNCPNKNNLTLIYIYIVDSKLRPLEHGPKLKGASKFLKKKVFFVPTDKICH